MKPIIYPYKIGSHSAHALAETLGTICVRENGRYVPRMGHLIVNWGNPRWPAWSRNMRNLNQLGEFLNPPDSVEIAHDKFKTLLVLKESNVSVPSFTTNENIARQWIEGGRTVLARTSLIGHSGIGIHVCHLDNELVHAPLYVEYIPKRKEFRVHVFNGQIIGVQQKRKVAGEEADYLIRSHDRGWVFTWENVVEPEALRGLALASVKALGLDFGAVDIIWNEKRNQCYVLEVNTAPGIEGRTIQMYANSIRGLL